MIALILENGQASKEFNSPGELKHVDFPDTDLMHYDADFPVITKDRVPYSTATWGLLSTDITEISQFNEISGGARTIELQGMVTWKLLKMLDERITCLVPVTGFYKRVLESGEIAKYELPNGQVAYVAGIMYLWVDMVCEYDIFRQSFAFLTYNGLPVVLSEENQEKWLSTEVTEELIAEIMNASNTDNFDIKKTEYFEKKYLFQTPNGSEVHSFINSEAALSFGNNQFADLEGVFAGKDYDEQVKIESTK